jgi:hypothetical protein
VIETDAGLSRLDRGAWKPVASAPRHVAALLSDHFAMADGERGIVDLRTGKTISWPSGVHVHAAAAIDDDTVLAAATHNTSLELLTCHGGAMVREPITVDAPFTVVAIVGDHTGRVVIALRDGRLLMRDHSTWTSVSTRDEVPSLPIGPPPANSS